MDAEEAIRSRRTVKVFENRPIERETLEELLELARWAPNHNLTNPWRFRVVGPKALERLKEAAAELGAATAPAGGDPLDCGRVAAAKLDRAPTLVVCSVLQTGEEQQDEEDMHAAGVAAYIVLLAAHGRGLAGYWRTPGVLRTDTGRAAVELPAGERFVGLLYLGHARQGADPPGREPVEHYATFLD